MDKQEFELLFDERLQRPLAQLGFHRVGRSMIFHDELSTIALFRLGGRMSSEGSISQLLCFRHTFLRDFSEARPTNAPQNPFEYPFKFRPSLLQEKDQSQWQYVPQNLDYSYDRFVWENRNPHEAQAWLEHLSDFLGRRFLPWAQAASPKWALEQLKTHGQQAWCEQMWISDYSQLANKN